MKIIGNTVGTTIPKPNLMQTDPKKGDYVKGKEEFLGSVPEGGGKTPVKGVDYFTPEEIQEIAEQAAGMVEVPEGGGGGLSRDEVQTMINEALGGLGTISHVEEGLF